MTYHRGMECDERAELEPVDENNRPFGDEDVRDELEFLIRESDERQAELEYQLGY